LEDQEAATQDALRRAVAEEVKREGMVARLKAEQVRSPAIPADRRPWRTARCPQGGNCTLIRPQGGTCTLIKLCSCPPTAIVTVASYMPCDSHVSEGCVLVQASLEKKLRAANLQKRNADRANELSAVMRQVHLALQLLAQL
jgi:hypothetical protein